MKEMKKRLTIGFLIHHLDNDYSKAILAGASAAARELDINLAIFPGRSLNSQLDDRKFTAYEYQNNVIYSYVNSSTLDAAVISAGTLGSFVSKEEFKEFVDSFGELPIITTENKIEGYPCIRLSGSGIKEIISHLVKRHGKKHIAFVSGPKTNADAVERLKFYIEALEENGLEYDPEYVAYGKFSEYCVDIVGNLIDKHKGELDAICFANDMMCKGGYKAIERRGLRVGKDIAVTGYDDSEIAVTLKPMLTTVKADAAALGSRAVREAVKMALGEFDGVDISLDSSPIYRASCGCKMHSGDMIQEGSVIFDNTEETADNILREQIPRYDEALVKYEKVAALRKFTIDFLNYSSEHTNSADFERDMKAVFSGLADTELLKIVRPEKLMRILKNIRVASNAISSGFDSAEAVIADCFETTCEHIINMHYAMLDDITFTNFLIGNITKDMTACGGDEKKCFFSIVNNLYRAHIDSSYIFTYETPITHTKIEKWQKPDTLMLRAYHDGDKLETVNEEESRISSDKLLRNDYTSEERCRIMTVSPLFMNEEQFGLIVCELENEYFPYIYSITPQICTAIKLTNLVGQLESSLDAAESRNSMLNRMSMCDELTGISNRRGFYISANRILKAPENEGRKAVLIFADLDNLKTINDTFGHDDGDYAIISASSFLKNSLRVSDVVARIGGDEFAAFAIGGDMEMMSSLPSRIKNIAKLHNMRSNKPYNVTISIGMCEITCAPDRNIQQFMDNADAALYADKKKKNRNIFKEGQEPPNQQ